ncbi:hypothetical protein ACSSS7_000279 [Eimeria intestinalis]
MAESEEPVATAPANSLCCTPCNEREGGTEREPLFPWFQLSPDLCPHAPHATDPQAIGYIKDNLLPAIQQDSLRALVRARRAQKEKKEGEGVRGDDGNRADRTDDACIEEEVPVHPVEDKMHATPNGFSPLLALAEALQRISQKTKTTAAAAAATTAAATTAAAAGEDAESAAHTSTTPGSRDACD